mmetsp:Transcript_2151/g.6348  ORF Transcript_2151/g.6348 Transcript_2151/m.6348 type:complete len:313 (-) Transcript_2151:301-1239(-)|eukprot:CAMPEP_0117657140 /NCGR_PEP_ID=MMETSP0804-20121206/5175_1 /TAXON_ID=1074897 /ORGANISM="Tetraselmis astigmatica, Strain CCMP880" /LENGTH=312 /DNA_ID=CAMNT_0005463581 /DNA_START=99 /DNA_END=1037 /DNA_ORIENTATION=-
MGERKVLNKYYPPDFDPAKLPRGRKPKDAQMKVRMMLPMSIQCSTCGNFMYKGTKFNSRKEDALGENYLGIQIFRFYFRCSKCAAEITMKTDPQNSDYSVEHGATRNYEPWRDKDKQIEDAVAEREAEEMGNAMKALENRTIDSKREMDIMSALDEMKALKAQHSKVDTEAALAALQRSADQEEMLLVDEDETAVRELLEQRKRFVKRIEEEEAAPKEKSQELLAKPKETKPGNFGVSAKGIKMVVKAKRKAPEGPCAAGGSTAAAGDSKKPKEPHGVGGSAAPTADSPPGTGGLLGLAGYGSGSSGESGEE